MEIKFKLDEKDLESLLCSALEGGSNYWVTEVDAVIPEKMDCFMSEVPFKKGTLIITDGEDNNKKYYLNIAKVKKGAKVMLEKYPKHFANILSEEADSETGDVFLQCCVFGEIIYS